MSTYYTQESAFRWNWKSGLAVFLTAGGVLALGAWFVQFLWNWVVSDVLGLFRHLTYTEAIGVWLCLSMLSWFVRKHR